MAEYSEHNPNYVPALRKGFALLELLAERGPMSLAQVERASGLNRTVSYRLPRVMGELGYVEHDLDEHTYGLGPRVLELGAVVAGRLNITQIAWPFLASLREEMQETVTLGVLSGTEIVYLGMLESPRAPNTATRLGGRDPVHATSLGKAILAFHPSRERDLKVASLDPLQRMTPKTIVDPRALAFDLKRTRERGYAIADEEHTIGTRCIGVPVLADDGQPLAGLSLCDPIERIGLHRAESIAARLWVASREMSGRMGHAPGRLAS